jgi:O-antigen/teichoic acid export membrane protein
MHVNTSNMANWVKNNGRLNWTLADQAMVSGVNFLVSILIAKFLGIETFGIFTLLWMSVLFVQSIQSAIIITPMMSIGPKQCPNERARYFGVVITQQIFFSIASSIVLYLAVILSGQFFPQWNIVEYGSLLVITVFLSQNQDFVRRLYFIEGKVVAAFFNDAICYGGRLVVLLFFFFNKQISLNHIFVIISGLLSVSLMFGCFTLYKPCFDYQYNLKVIKRHWKFSKWLLAASLTQWTSGNYFIIAAGALLGPTAVGILRAVGNVIGITNILFQGLENIIPSSASRHLMGSGIVGLRAYLMKVFVYGGLAILSLATLLSIFSEQILTIIYNKEYAEYRYILVWYAVISLIAYSIIPLVIGLRTLEYTKPIFTSYFITTIFSISTANYLITSFNISGVMIGIAVNNLIMLLISYIYFTKTSQAYVL